MSGLITGHENAKRMNVFFFSSKSIHNHANANLRQKDGNLWENSGRALWGWETFDFPNHGQFAWRIPWDEPCLARSPMHYESLWLFNGFYQLIWKDRPAARRRLLTQCEHIVIFDRWKMIFIQHNHHDCLMLVLKNWSSPPKYEAPFIEFHWQSVSVQTFLLKRNKERKIIVCHFLEQVKIC